MLDQLIEIQPMPEEFNSTKAVELCNDCGKQTEVKFHYVGLKCPNCGSYNTKTLSTTGFPQITPEAARDFMQQAQSAVDSHMNGNEEETEESDDEDKEEEEEANNNNHHEQQNGQNGSPSTNPNQRDWTLIVN